jgi:N-formylglutamate deformylase
MSQSYTLIKGRVPLLISMPHNGQEIPDEIAAKMSLKARAVPDTDWYKDKLYDFAVELGAYILIPKFNRYVIDLNRDPNGIDLYPGANSTELCPTTAFDLSPLYIDGYSPDEVEIKRRTQLYWQPYHQAIETTLAKIKQQFNQAVLLEAHSILSHVPRFFDGRLPDFNFGNSDGKSCSDEMLERVRNLVFSPYTMVCNGRFKGGFITREYGQPQNNIHALQLELSQITYMNESTLEYNQQLASLVKPKLKLLVECLIEFAQEKRAN